MRVDRADPDGPGARHAADQAVRLRGAQGAVSAAVRQRRVVAGVRAVRARGRLGPGRDADSRGPRRRRMGDRRDQELDHQPRRRRLLRRVRGHRPRGRPARGITAFVVEADRPGFSVGKLEHKLGIRGSPTGQPIFDGVRVPAGEHRRGGQRGLQGRDGDARPLPPRSRLAGAGDRPGRDRLRGRLRPRAPAVRQADQLVSGDPVQARRHGDAVRRRAGAALPGLRQGRPRRSATSASTRRWPSCSAPTWRWR